METFGEVLRRHRERRGLTQDGAASSSGVSRATFTQWEGNKHLPSVGRVHELDRALEAVRCPRRCVGGGPSAQPIRPPSRSRHRTVPPAGLTLATVLRNARRALDGQLCFDDSGRAIGWRHNLVPSRRAALDGLHDLRSRCAGPSRGPRRRTPTRSSNAYWRPGCRPTERSPAGRRARSASHGWRRPHRPSVAVACRGAPEGRQGRRGDRAPPRRDLARAPVHPRPSPSSRCSASHPAPRSPLTIVRDLLDCRRDFHGTLLWPEKQLQRDQPLLDPSVSHTARAVTALRNAPAELVGDAVTTAEEWLAEQAEPRRGHRNRPAHVSTTDARGTGVPPLHVGAGRAGPGGSQKTGHTSDQPRAPLVWERYDPALHLWAWGNGDVPVWMLVDAVAALQAAANAHADRPSPG